MYNSMNGKEILQSKFSQNFKKYYEVELFRNEGFDRRQCIQCSKYFWTLDNNRKTCPEQPCQQYGFIGYSPTSNNLDYLNTWKTIENFFVKNSHQSIDRYPVVARWRPDLFFTIASIVDFQRIEGGKVTFDFPSDPLVVPQVCLRFNDIQNVGVSGKHFTSFVMIGQHSGNGTDGYWKDRCIDLDFQLLNKEFGIQKEEITFKEDVWVGYGAFGYSLEYYVRGLELGNAVFTEFEGSPENFKTMDNKIIDMGAGLERFSWLTQGTSTAYESVFGPVVDKMFKSCGIEYDRDLFFKYSKLAGNLNVDEITNIKETKTKIASQIGVSLEQLENNFHQIENAFAILDHTKTLLFAITDGALPSNVGGGYNLRVLLRRALSMLLTNNWSVDLNEISDWHISYLSNMYPELREHRDEIHTVLDIEKKRYYNTQSRTNDIIKRLKTSSSISTDELITLYDSEGIPPELLKDRGVNIEIPTDFYKQVTDRHLTHKLDIKKITFDLKSLDKTRTLFYEDQTLMEFDGKILRKFEDDKFSYLVLDQTAFYARAGGQEPDLGTLNGKQVIDVEKYGDIILHKIEGKGFSLDESVHGIIDSQRRDILTKHHTATHIMLGAAKRALGSWIWQSSAFKDVDKARLDITHFEHLSKEKIHEIENLANHAIRMNLSVQKLVMDRKKAEKKYGFTIYQGGIAPSKELRIQDIDGWDVECCAGTHVSNTGEIGLIKIIKNERIQDGVERLEYVAGQTAINFIHQQDTLLSDIRNKLSVQSDKIIPSIQTIQSENDTLKKQIKGIPKRMSKPILDEILNSSTSMQGIKFNIIDWEEFDENFHINVGSEAISKIQDLLYVGMCSKDKVCRFIVFSGTICQQKNINANDIVKGLAEKFGGSGGGTPKFAQGGCPKQITVNDVEQYLNSHLS